MKALKNKKFQIKLTNQEHELLKRKSKQLNISISDYLRISSINLLKNDYEKTNDNSCFDLCDTRLGARAS